MRPRRGFTLVELLVVIAIIGILAGFVAVALPRVIMKAKITDTTNTMKQLRTILVSYYTDHNSLPPAYGYLSPAFLKDTRFSNPDTRAQDIVNAMSDPTDPISQNHAFFLLPWMSAVREHGNDKLNDRWTRGNGYDTDKDGTISRLEFAPRGVFNGGNQTYSFNYSELYLGNNGDDNSDTNTILDVQEQLQSSDTRPLIYVPVNERQARVFRKIMFDMAGRNGGNTSDPRPFNLDTDALNAIRTQLSFPPPSLDKFVLISVGPNFASGTNGIIVDADRMGLDTAGNSYDFVNQYYLVGLATYFLATRDFEAAGKGDGELDFDFTARSTRGQGDNPDNDMPGKFPKGDGPIIYVGD